MIHIKSHPSTSAPHLLQHLQCSEDRQVEIHSSKGFRLPKFQSPVLRALSKVCPEEVCTYKEINKQAKRS